MKYRVTTLRRESPRVPSYRDYSEEISAPTAEDALTIFRANFSEESDGRLKIEWLSDEDDFVPPPRELTPEEIAEQKELAIDCDVAGTAWDRASAIACEERDSIQSPVYVGTFKEQGRVCRIVFCRQHDQPETKMLELAVWRKAIDVMPDDLYMGYVSGQYGVGAIAVDL